MLIGQCEFLPSKQRAREARRRHVGVSVSLMFGVFVFLRPWYVIIMAAIVEWAYKAKSRPHITVGVCSERLCSYVVTSKHVFLVWEKLFLLS